MHHTLPATRESLHARFLSTNAPVLTVASGDTVTITNIPDVSWGLEPPTSTTAPRRKFEPRDPTSNPTRDRGPCLCGPIAVAGAEPGDTLEIHIEHLRTAPWGWTYAGRGMSTPSLNAALGLADSPLTLLRWTIDRERGTATSHLGHTVPTNPFLGTIGLAPNSSDDPDPCPWTPRPCGGNMDCRELTAGTTLYLPIMTPGALLSIGDTHAAQADGELSGTAIETMAEETRLRLTLHKPAGATTPIPHMPIPHIRTPLIRTPTSWITLAFAPTLDTAAELAASAMLDLIEHHLHLPRPEAAALASAKVHLRITQMVNPHRGVHAILPT